MGIYERDMAEYKKPKIVKKKVKKVTSTKTKYVVIKGKAYPMANQPKIKKPMMKKKPVKKLTKAEQVKKNVVGFFQNAGRQSLMKKTKR